MSARQLKRLQDMLNEPEEAEEEEDREPEPSARHGFAGLLNETDDDEDEDEDEPPPATEPAARSVRVIEETPAWPGQSNKQRRAHQRAAEPDEQELLSSAAAWRAANSSEPERPSDDGPDAESEAELRKLSVSNLDATNEVLPPPLMP